MNGMQFNTERAINIKQDPKKNYFYSSLVTNNGKQKQNIGLKLHITHIKRKLTKHQLYIKVTGKFYLVESFTAIKTYLKHNR